MFGQDYYRKKVGVQNEPVRKEEKGKYKEGSGARGESNPRSGASWSVRLVEYLVEGGEGRDA